jgi:pyruvate dehydrogenase (quinone)
MQMNGLNELITVEKYWKNWSDPRLIFIVLNNRDLNQITWEMRIEEGNPQLPMTQIIPDYPYDEFARSPGFLGIRIDQPEQLGPAFDQALSTRMLQFVAKIS